MSEKTIFFSYSRDNSDFVLNLAKELREAGAKVWLDQLDIKPGTRWDKSIETALKESSTLLVVLSKSSVASHNVMDEVSYALEEGKTVVPVLLEDCEIPFRLRRLQFADFTTSHKTGKETLSKALNLGEEVKSKLVSETGTPAKEPVAAKPAPVATSTVSETSPPAQEAAATVAAKATASAKSSGSKKGLMYAVIAVIAVVAIWGIYSITSSGEGHTDMMAQCKADWQELETDLATDKESFNELAALRKHIELYAPCPHENEAMDRISFLKAMGGDAGDVVTTENGTENQVNNTNSSNTSANTGGTPGTNNNAENTNNTEPEETPIEVTEEVIASNAVNGNNVQKVTYNGGMFIKKNQKVWLEVNDNGERIFRVANWDQDAVYLRDGDVKIRLDVTNFVVYYADANTEEFQLYVIDEISDTQ